MATQTDEELKRIIEESDTFNFKYETVKSVRILERIRNSEKNLWEIIEYCPDKGIRKTLVNSETRVSTESLNYTLTGDMEL
jgi:hypothetical protein